jgi:Ca-activated chloride channel family protein
MQNSKDSQILITPLKPALIVGVAQNLPVLVRVKAPDNNPAQKKSRKPYRLSLVIDRSGSMSGEPLREAVRCAQYIVDHLEATDVAALTVFDDRVISLVPASPVGDRSAFHAALRQIHEGGSTNLYGGWQAGALSILTFSILKDAEQSALSRVILLSDGNANAGETTDTQEIAARCAETAEKGVSTSTYGLGRHFNEELMIEMAKRGGGNHYYGDTAADLFEPFVEEFELISNLYARHVHLSLTASKDVKIKLLNDYPLEQREGFPLIRLPDIPFGAEAWALVELEIPAGLALESGVQLLQASVTASTPDGIPITLADTTLTLNALSLQAWEALLQDPLVTARQAEIEAGKFLDLARAASENGDWETLQKMLAEACARFADHPWVVEVLSGMAEIAQERDIRHFHKEARYSGRKMSSRVSAKEEMLFCLDGEANAPSFLRRKKSQGKAQY